MSPKSLLSSLCVFLCVTDGRVVHGRVLGRDGGDEVFRRLIKDLFPSTSCFNENLDFIVDTVSCPLETYLNSFFTNVFPEIIILCILFCISVLIRIETGKYHTLNSYYVGPL